MKLKLSLLLSLLTVSVSGLQAGGWLPWQKTFLYERIGERTRVQLPEQTRRVMAQTRFEGFEASEREKAFMVAFEPSPVHGHNPRDYPLEYSKVLNLVARQYAYWLMVARETDGYSAPVTEVLLSYWEDQWRGEWAIDGANPNYLLAVMGIDLWGGEHIPVQKDTAPYYWDEATQKWKMDEVWNEELGQWEFEPVDVAVEIFHFGQGLPVYQVNATGSLALRGDEPVEAAHRLDSFIYNRSTDPLAVGIGQIFGNKRKATHHKVYGVGHVPGGTLTRAYSGDLARTETKEIPGVYVVLSINSFVNPDEDFWREGVVEAVTQAESPMALARHFEHLRRFPWPQARIESGTREAGTLVSDWFGRFHTGGIAAAPWIWHDQLGALWTQADEFGHNVHEPPEYVAGSPGQMRYFLEEGIEYEPASGSTSEAPPDMGWRLRAGSQATRSNPESPTATVPEAGSSGTGSTRKTPSTARLPVRGASTSSSGRPTSTRTLPTTTTPLGGGAGPPNAFRPPGS